MSASDDFFRVAYQAHTTSEGPVELPIAYYENHHVVAVFAVEPGRAARALAGTGFTAVHIGRYAYFALVFYDYPRTAIGDYHEVGLAALVVREGDPVPRVPLLDVLRNPRQRALGMHVLALPVTTERACSAGRELWGYPKIVTKIPIEWRGRDFRGAVLDPRDGRLVLELSGHYGGGIPIPTPPLLTYSRLHGTALRTVIDMRGTSQLVAPGTLRLTLPPKGPAPHELTVQLEQLGLRGARPRFALVTRGARSLLHAGERF